VIYCGYFEVIARIEISSNAPEIVISSSHFGYPSVKCAVQKYRFLRNNKVEKWKGKVVLDVAHALRGIEGR